MSVCGGWLAPRTDEGNELSGQGAHARTRIISPSTHVQSQLGSSHQLNQLPIPRHAYSHCSVGVALLDCASLMADSEPELVQVRLAGPVAARLNATFLPLAQSSVQDLVNQLLQEDGQQIKVDVLGSAEAGGERDELSVWGIRHSSSATKLDQARIDHFKRETSNG